MKTQQDIWQKLQEQSIVKGELSASDKIKTPWFIKLLLAFSGWFASLFIFGFFLLILNELIENSIACLLIGAGLIFIAYHTLQKKHSEFLEHLMLACSLAGQALIAWALFITESTTFSVFPWLALFILQSALSLFMPHYIHRACCAFFASLAFTICLYYWHLSAFTSASLLLLVMVLILNEWHSIKWQPIFESISYGVISLLILLKATHAISYDLSYWLNESAVSHTWYAYLDELLLIFSMIYLILTLISRSPTVFPIKIKRVILIATIGLCLLSMQASGITLSVALLILGFSNSNKLLQALGLTSLLFYISSYYYLLTLTLLEKSGILLIMGIFILIIRYVLLNWFKIVLIPPTIKGDKHAI